MNFFFNAFLLCILLLGEQRGFFIENKDFMFSYHPSPARNFILASLWVVLEYLIFFKKISILNAEYDGPCFRSQCLGGRGGQSSLNSGPAKLHSETLPQTKQDASIAT